MNFEKLLNERVIEPYEVSSEEIAYLLGVARRDLRTGKTVSQSNLDWAFAITYNSILQLSVAYMNYLGYRPRAGAKHVNTFKFMEKALSKDQQSMVRRIQKLRRKRNITIYERAGEITEKEVRDIVEFATRYYNEVESKPPKAIIEKSYKLENE